MAKVFWEGTEDTSRGMQILKKAVKTTIPDYIHVGFEVAIGENRDFSSSENSRETDALMIVPHLGVFMVEAITGGVAYIDGELYRISPTGQRMRMQLDRNDRMKRRMLLQFFRDKAGITPLVHTIYFFVDIYSDTEQNTLNQVLGTAIFAKDLDDELTFMKKIFDAYLANMKRNRLHDEDGSLRYSDDLDDSLCEEIILEWCGKENWARPKRPPFLFLSYNHHDKKMAFQMKRVLEKKGIFIWRAPEDIPLGEDYKKHEVTAIKECYAFVILLSEDSMNSDEVWFELQHAIAAKKRIFPILVEECEVTPRYYDVLTHYEWREMFQLDQAVMDEIVRRVNE